MNIIIGASKNNQIGSKLIRWWTKAPYSHVYAKWHLSSQDRDIVYHASHGLVHFIGSERFSSQNTIVDEWTINVSDDIFRKFSKKCIDLAGEEYSTLQLFRIFLSDISGGKLKFKDSKGYICSELMAELLEDLGIPTEKPKYMMRPSDIILALELIAPTDKKS